MSEDLEKYHKRNIMVMFLSTLHGKWANEQKTILKWAPNEGYYSICQPEAVPCLETNEAPLTDISKSLGKPLDAIFYFSTDQVGIYPPPEGEPLQERLTILFPPDFKKPGFYDSEAHFFWTERAPEVLGELYSQQTRLFPIAFKENDSDPVGSAIKAMTKMEKTIKNYLKSEGVALDECSLYADITGGKRTANMALSALMQLLQFEDVHLRRVVYSDFDHSRKGKDGKPPLHPVSNVQPIHDMYRLVAGVDAFQKYGSTAALKEYFGDEIKNPTTMYPPLKILLDAMDKFSEGVLLCQPNTIEGTLKQLIEALQAFPEERKDGELRPAKVDLFARMLPSLWEKYEPMYHAPAEGGPITIDRLEVIKWCVENMLLQPAVTFCVEWLPDYFVDNGVAYTDDQAVQLYCEDKGFPPYRPGWKNFLMEYCTKWPIPSNDMYNVQSAPERIAEIARECHLSVRTYTYDARRQSRYFRQEKETYPLMGKKCWNVGSISRAMLDCGMMQTECDKEKAAEYIRDYTYIRVYIRNKLDHANQQDDTDGILVPLEMDAIHDYLTKFLDRVEETANSRHSSQGLWDKETREEKWKERLETITPPHGRRNQNRGNGFRPGNRANQ